MDESIRIIKEPVLGMIIVRHKRHDGKDFVSVGPIVANDDTFADVDIDLEEGDKALGVLPAPPEAFKVLGLFPDEGHEEDLENGTYKEIGFEFKGVETDWIAKLNDRLKIHEECLARSKAIKEKKK